MFVEEVTVTNKEGDTVVFPCRCWLGKDDSNSPIIRELIPGKPVPEEPEGKKVNTTADNYNRHQMVLHLTGNGSSKMEREKRTENTWSGMEAGLGSDRVNVGPFCYIFQFCVDLRENLLY